MNKWIDENLLLASLGLGGAVTIIGIMANLQDNPLIRKSLLAIALPFALLSIYSTFRLLSYLNK